MVLGKGQINTSFFEVKAFDALSKMHVQHQTRDPTIFLHYVLNVLYLNFSSLFPQGTFSDKGTRKGGIEESVHGHYTDCIHLNYLKLWTRKTFIIYSVKILSVDILS